MLAGKVDGISADEHISLATLNNIKRLTQTIKSIEGRNQACDVVYWHLTDDQTAPAFVRYWSNSGNAEEQENLEESLIDQATASQSVAELAAEISILQVLEQQAKALVASGKDRKWDELSRILQTSPRCTTRAGECEKSSSSANIAIP